MTDHDHDPAAAARIAQHFERMAEEEDRARGWLILLILGSAASTVLLALGLWWAW